MERLVLLACLFIANVATAGEYHCDGMTISGQQIVISGVMPAPGIQNPLPARLTIVAPASDSDSHPVAESEVTQVYVGFGAGLFSVKSAVEVGIFIDIVWDLRSEGTRPNLRWYDGHQEQHLLQPHCELKIK